MRTIHKFQVHPGRFVLEMPEAFKVLTVQMQGGFPMMWAEVYTESPKIPRVFYGIGTGHEMPIAELKYHGTFQLIDGTVWHLYEVKK